MSAQQTNIRIALASLGCAFALSGSVAYAITDRATMLDEMAISAGRQFPIWSAYRDLPVMRVVVGGANGSDGGIAGSCPTSVIAHTDANFGGGSFIVQAGFAEMESAACSYLLPAAAFPLRLDMTEMIFATSAATVQTTTKWSVMVWEGTPATGTLKYTFSSDAKIIPHIVLPPGTSGVNVQFLIDPNDPDQMYLNDNGSHTFSIGYRIDDHNNQTQNPCFVAPPSASNAFPTTDTSGLAQPSQNWINAVNCGTLGCPPGWKTFAQWPTACRPTGDWVMRATYTPINCAALQGACCIGTGCAISTMANCAAAGGLYRGDGSVCSASICLPQGNNACCFAATGGCVNLSYQSCLGAGGTPGPEGSLCASYVCFPTGACCLSNGTCAGGVSPSACASQGGNYQGNGTTCAGVNCPAPVGASCFPSGFCLILTQAEAINAGASWAGAGTLCTDANGNGTADLCEGNPADVNNDGFVNGIDLASVLSAWGTSGGAADINNDGIVNGVDLASILSNWTG
ncbi:MAG: hypothetical protein EXS15_02100 [Phycisphaerales bacterium]|nr:hypothetical protein [Phycisphaerales bacterium]